jgi:hypothetical protein
LYDNFHIIIGGSLTHYIDEFYVDIDELIKFSEEEKESPRFKGKNYKSDSKTLKSFGKDYFEACDYIGLFDDVK